MYTGLKPSTSTGISSLFDLIARVLRIFHASRGTSYLSITQFINAIWSLSSPEINLFGSSEVFLKLKLSLM